MVFCQMKSSRPSGQSARSNVEQGAATSVWGATAPELDGRGGLYLENCGVAEPAAGTDAPGGYLEYALDLDAAERLWTLSEEIVGETFEF